MNSVVIGLNFGDEGKGVVTNFLAKTTNRDVVRYSGGSQAGHTVVENGIKHVFSGFGSGTLSGKSTYWEDACPFDPVSVINEMAILKEKTRKTPQLYVSSKCPLVTPMDKFANKQGVYLENGTCGAGIGTTITREEANYHLLLEDTFNSFIFREKFIQIQKYYKDITPIEEYEFYFKSINLLLDLIKPFKKNSISYTNHIFESSQGLLLDPEMGIFPHVTRIPLGIEAASKYGKIDEVWYVTRAYLTRHGNGPMPNETFPEGLILNENETNITNDYQGNFRVGTLDLSLLLSTLIRNLGESPSIRYNLVITCLDQFPSGKIPVITRQETKLFSIKEIAQILTPFVEIYACDSDTGNIIKVDI